MTKKIVIMIHAIFLLIFMQGCVAEKIENQKYVEPSVSGYTKTVSEDDQEIVIDDRSIANAHWCGSKVVMYQVFTGQYDEISHPIYNEIWWKNIESGKGGMVSSKGGIYGCSPDGQWLIFGEKNFTIPKSEIHKLSSADVAKKYDIKLKNVVTGEEELLPKGDFYVERTTNNWSGDGKKVFIRSFSEGKSDVYLSKINKNLKVYYLPYENEYYAWLPASDSVVGSKKSEGIGLWKVSDKTASFQKLSRKDVKNLTEWLLFKNGIFDLDGNWYVQRRNKTEVDSGRDNILKCKVEDMSLECKELLPGGVFAPPVYSVLPSGEAIHFRGYLNGSKTDRMSIRYSIDSGKMIDLNLYKDQFPIDKLIVGQFSPDGKWVFSRNGERLVIVDMANYYTLFGGSK